MNLLSRFTRRAVLPILAAAFVLTLGQAVQAKKTDYNLKGTWDAGLTAQGFPTMPNVFAISKPTKKGKFSGTSTSPGDDPVDLAGKAKAKGKFTLSFPATFGGDPVDVRLTGKVNRGGTDASGTFEIVDMQRQVLLEGTFSMQKR